MGQRVIDMSKIRMDFFRDEINAGTLRILDRAFFEKETSLPTTNGQDIAIGRKEQVSKQKLPSVKANELGFGFDSDSDKNSDSKKDEEKKDEVLPLPIVIENPETHLTKLAAKLPKNSLKENHKMKTDIQAITALCQDQIVREEHDAIDDLCGGLEEAIFDEQCNQKHEQINPFLAAKKNCAEKNSEDSVASNGFKSFNILVE